MGHGDEPCHVCTVLVATLHCSVFVLHSRTDSELGTYFRGPARVNEIWRLANSNSEFDCICKIKAMRF
jgi:hypothetical protein